MSHFFNTDYLNRYISIIIFFLSGIVFSQDYADIKVDKNEVLKNIHILREAGFFKVYGDMSDVAVFDSIHSQRIKEYSRIFEREYDPGMDLDAISIAQIDTTKLLYSDLEADVLKGNDAYIKIINDFKILSNEQFWPTDIEEKWRSTQGPIKVSFKSDNRLVEFDPEYLDDWLSEKVFEICKEELKRKKVRIVYCLSEDGMGYGQDIAIMRLTKEQQRVLEKKLKWQFSK